MNLCQSVFRYRLKLGLLFCLYLLLENSLESFFEFGKLQKVIGSRVWGERSFGLQMVLFSSTTRFMLKKITFNRSSWHVWYLSFFNNLSHTDSSITEHNLFNYFSIFNIDRRLIFDIISSFLETFVPPVHRRLWHIIFTNGTL